MIQLRQEFVLVYYFLQYFLVSVWQVTPSYQQPIEQCWNWNVAATPPNNSCYLKCILCTMNYIPFYKGVCVICTRKQWIELYTIHDRVRNFCFLNTRNYTICDFLKYRRKIHDITIRVTMGRRQCVSRVQKIDPWDFSRSSKLRSSRNAIFSMYQTMRE